MYIKVIYKQFELKSWKIFNILCNLYMNPNLRVYSALNACQRETEFSFLGFLNKILNYIKVILEIRSLHILFYSSESKYYFKLASMVICLSLD